MRKSGALTGLGISEAAGRVAPVASRSPRAFVEGIIGVLIFSVTLPATRLALGSFDAFFLTAARAAIAGIVAGAVLLVLRQRRPRSGDLGPLLIVALGVVIGFPLLTALAMRHVGAAHATVFVGLLPLTTALFGALRAGERPSGAFWALSMVGSAVTVAYAARNANGISGIGDGLMICAVLVCGLGYAEGGLLARRLGGWQVIAWADLLALPLTLPLALLWLPADPLAASLPAWACLAYVSLFSMLIGFMFWYRALARGGIAAIGQLQLLQPFLAFGFAAALLGEQIEPAMLAAAAAVVVCVAVARRLA